MKKKILLVDDEADITAILSASLKFHDFEVDILTSSKDVVKILKETKYDVLVTDLMMEPFDGIQLCRKIRKDKEIKDMNIIVLSAKRLSAEESKELLILNVNFVQKPFVSLSLIEKIQEVIS